MIDTVALTHIPNEQAHMPVMDASTELWNSVASTGFLARQTLQSGAGLESPWMEIEGNLDRNLDDQETDLENQTDKGSDIEETDSSVKDSLVTSDFDPMTNILSTVSATGSGDDDCSEVSLTKKRKRSIVPSDRLNRARLLQTMPIYGVKQSTEHSSLHITFVQSSKVQCS
jgi:hypothetical protein